MKIQNGQGGAVIDENGPITIVRNDVSTIYSVLEKKGKLSENCYCVLNYIYVNEGHKEAFESKF